MSSFRDFEHRAPVGGALRTGLRLGGRLDRYVAELFVGSYAVALLLVVGIFVIINLASNIDEYLRAGPDGSTPSGWLVVKLYIYQTPFLFLEVAPFVTLVGGLFTASRLMKNREVVAGLAAGVSVRRMLLPVFLIGGLLGAGMFGFREWVAESLGGRRDALLDYLVERRPEEVLENLWVKDPKGNPVRVEAYYPGTWGVAPRLEGLGATLRKGNSWTNVVATRAVFDKARNVWDLEGGSREDVDGGAQTREQLATLDGELFSPRDLRTAWKGRVQPTELSFQETLDLLARDPDAVGWQTLLQSNLAFPFAHLVLLFVGLPFLLGHARSKGPSGGLWVFFLCLCYFGADFICRSLGLQGQLDPLMAAWLPILFFGSLGVVLFTAART
ncbi:MAG: LptF/LptG family permease [Planctomycetes bacterium]|nr:LptF/LptG family permease [Planctomycetota bacterium]